jgi:hypothetical protein
MSVYQELKRRIKRTVTFEPCLPRPAKAPPNGSGWIHEIKHDGFGIIAQKDVDGVRLITRNGYDFAERYPLIVDAIRRLSVKSCIVDGEAIVVDQEGLSVFDLLRYRRHDHAATLCAFDLIEVDGADLRRSPDRGTEAASGAAPPATGPRHCAQRDLRWRRCGHLRASLCARLRGCREQAAWLRVPHGPDGPMAQDQEPASTSRPA